jgi:hypothetical protein
MHYYYVLLSYLNRLLPPKIFVGARVKANRYRVIGLQVGGQRCVVPIHCLLRGQQSFLAIGVILSLFRPQ